MDLDRVTYEARGCSLSALRGGKGPRLLYLHGLEASGDLLPFLGELAESFEIFAPEHPGFGASADPSWLSNIHDLAYFYLDLLDDMGGAPFHVVGASIGGWAALEMAVRNSTRIASLSLCAPAGIYAQGLSRGDIFLWSTEERIRNFYFDQATAEKVLEGMDPLRDFDETYKNALTLARIAWEPRLFDPFLKKWLHRITVPTQIIWGEDDKVLPAGYASEFAKLIPQATVHRIAQCGHLSPIEKPMVLTSLISSFAKGLSK